MTAQLDTLHFNTERIRMQILQNFIAAKESYISGGDLAEKLQITRTAVWKHIRWLEAAGFEFEAAPRRGYRLSTSPNIVMEPLLRPYLSDTAELGSTVIWLPSVTSTNAIANELAKNPQTMHGTVVTALRQEGGKGRQGRAWSSPAGGLWLSVILKRQFALMRAAELTLMASVAIVRAVEQVADISLDIKWPNDLLYQNKKVCGILAELRAGGEAVQYAVLGIGLNSNVNSQNIPEDLQNIATSLKIASGVEVNQAQLAGAILSQFETLYTSLTKGESGFRGVADEWRTRCTTIGRHIRVQTPQAVLEGVAVDVDNHGILKLRRDDGEEVLVHSGDVLF